MKRMRVFLLASAVLVCLCSGAFGASPTYTISGVVATVDGAGVEGVSVAADNEGGSVVTAADGSYSIVVPKRWSGTVSVNKEGWLITPSSKSYSLVIADTPNENYTAYQPKISGVIKKQDGSVLEGATVTASNGAGSGVSDVNGYYEIALPYGWSGAVSASLADYFFADMNFTSVTADMTGQDFSGFQPTITGSTEVAGAMVTVSGIGSFTSTPNYSFIVPYGWSGTVSVSLNGYYYASSPRSYSNVVSDMAGQNFTVFQPLIMGSAGIAGATVTVSGVGSLISKPNYSLTVPYDWSGTVEVSLEGYYFAESPVTFSNVTTNMFGVNFTAYKPKITGTISSDTGPVTGVVVSADNGGSSYVTSADGYYSVDVPYGWSGTVDVEKMDWFFDPNERTYTNVTSDISEQDYTAEYIVIPGSGTEQDPYLILDIYDFDLIASDPVYWVEGVHVKMMCDLDLSGRSYTKGVIAPYQVVGTDLNLLKFNGVFDGNGHSISNMRIATDQQDYLGLFGYIGSSGEVRSLNVEKFYINGGSAYADYRVGSVCGMNYGMISNVNVDGVIEGRECYVGGLAGYNLGAIVDCHAVCTIEADDNVGGLCGSNYVTIEGSHAESTIKAGYAVGGLCGENRGTISNSYSVFDLDAVSHLGGICGSMIQGYLLNSYASGHIKSQSSFTGGICANPSYGSSVENCYANVSANTWIGGIYGARNGNSATNSYYYRFGMGDNGYGSELGGMEMLDAESYAGFDFAGNTEDGTEEIWSIIEGHLPKLSWQSDDGPVPVIETVSTTLSGSGYLHDPFVISDHDDLMVFRNNPSLRIGCYVLNDDIDLAGQTFDSSFVREYFMGFFDGNGHAIRNLTIDAPSNTDSTGFFYSTDGEILGLGLVNVNVVGRDNTGGLCGTISGTIENCYTTGSVLGGINVGGLCGVVSTMGSVKQSYSSCQVSAYNRRVGGLCGHFSGVISDCYSTGAVSGYNEVGGLCGYNYYYSGRVINCYSAGCVTGTSDVGGLIGLSRCQTMNSYWDTETSGLTESDGGTGFTTEQMQRAGNFQGYNCNGIWKIDEENDYPRLGWESGVGEALVEPTYGGGSGTEEDPYLIYTAEQFYDIGITDCHWDKHFKLMASLDLSTVTDRVYYAIGNSFDYFQGVFDGNFNTVDNLTVSLEATFLGVFGYIGEAGVVRNLGVNNSSVINLTDGYWTRSGGFAGSCTGNINGCFVRGGSVVSDCYAGGFVGELSGGAISNCYSSASVISHSESAGGFLGGVYSNGSVKYCYSTGEVSGNVVSGGFAAGQVNSLVVSCFWDIDSSGYASSYAGIGRHTDQMKQADTFMAYGLSGQWKIDEGKDYPRLVWEDGPGVVIPELFFAGGSGTKEDPYAISDANEFVLIGQIPDLWDDHFKLLNDIDLAQFEGAYTAIGFDLENAFTGTFEGNGKTISNLTMICEEMAGCGGNTFQFGLFKCINDPNSVVSNLNLTGINVVLENSVGGLVGHLEQGVISNCHISGSVSGQNAVGLLVGRNQRGVIENCSSTGSVIAVHEAGGLAGFNDGEIAGCFSTSFVYGGHGVGGLVGYNYGIVSNSYSEGLCVGESGVGGLVGGQYGESDISYSYAATYISGSYDTGGLVGGGQGVVNASFWDTEVSGMSVSAGGTGKTTAQMTEQMTFTDVGWDFDTPIWKMNEGVEYPRLDYQGFTGAVYAAGDGSAEQPYQLETPGQIARLCKRPSDWTMHFVLDGSIDLQGQALGGIGIYDTDKDINMPFTGKFDGKGNTISNYVCAGSRYGAVGLFNYVEGGEILDLKLENVAVYVTSPLEIVNSIDFAMGGLIGVLRGGSINNCGVKGGLVSGDRGYVGGLIGYTEEASIVNCYAECDVSGGDNTGGLCGGTIYYRASSFENCYASGDVEGLNMVGGFIGYGAGDFSGCYSTGDVFGIEDVGGFMGSGKTEYESLIEDSYASGAVSGTVRVGGFAGSCGYPIIRSYSCGVVSGLEYTGGFVGSDYYKPRPGDPNEMLVNCFWDIEASTQATSYGGEGLSTEEMFSAITYANWGCGSWTIDDGVDYPHLSWENRTGTPISANSYGGGTGQQDDPYLLYTPEQFNSIGVSICDLDKHFKLMADIDLELLGEEKINMIGSEIFPFCGAFDGNGYSISNFTYIKTQDDRSQSYAGLFGVVGEMRNVNTSANIHDLTLVDPNVIQGGSNTYGHTGSLAGIINGEVQVSNITVENAYVLDLSNDGSAGGVVGQNEGLLSNIKCTGNVEASVCTGGIAGSNYGVLTKCEFSGKVSGGNCTGGLVGRNSETIDQCSSKGTVEGWRSSPGLVNAGIGGLVGECSYGSLITDSYSRCDVTGDSRVGGLCGYVNKTIISNSYSSGIISGNESVGGFVGYYFDTYNQSEFIGCLWDKDRNPELASFGFGTEVGVYEETTENLKLQSTYTDIGWYFADELVAGAVYPWSICEGTNYPRFEWQREQGDYLCPEGVDLQDFIILAQHWQETDYGTVEGDLTNDGLVGIDDLSALAEYWLWNDCGDCHGVDLTGDGNVDLSDLSYIGQRWRENAYGDCGGAELTGDGKVDIQDFKVFAENWLSGVE
jgi:hypothetical protein